MPLFGFSANHMVYISEKSLSMLLIGQLKIMRDACDIVAWDISYINRIQP